VYTGGERKKEDTCDHYNGNHLEAKMAGPHEFLQLPDTRFGLELKDITDLVRGSSFQVFKSDIFWNTMRQAYELGFHKMGIGQGFRRARA
jgi:hypothetical protein